VSRHSRRTIGVAIGIPDPWGAYLDTYRTNVGDGTADAVPVHVTLLPPTEVNVAELDEISEHLRKVAAGHRDFDLHLRGTGTFRPITPVVFVVVAQGIGECELLERDIRSGPLTRELSFPYHPHVTIGHDLQPDQLDQAYEGLAGFDARFRVSGFTLFEHGADERWRPRQDYPFPEPLLPG
jgi:2'-5' RNA ligase